MVGIGITTYNRPECLKKCLEQIMKHSFQDKIKIYVAEDTDEDRRGVAFRKNECLRNLKECDHIFLFDDDCYPVNDKWIEFFISSGREHLLYLHPIMHKHYATANGVRLHKDCGGVFMYLIKETIERVGAFNEKYGLYGFEHADYSNRIYGKRNYYEMLEGTEKYIYAEDYGKNFHFKSSVDDDFKLEHFRKNWSKYFKEKSMQYIPL